MMNPSGVHDRVGDKPNENSKSASLSVATVCAHVATTPAMSVDVVL